MLTRTLIALIVFAALLAAGPAEAQRTRTDIDSGSNALLLGRIASTVELIATNGTIPARGGSAVRVSTQANVTGMILQKGTRSGATLVVMNVGPGTVTFAAAATSNVSYGTSAVIQAAAAATFIWDDASDLWRPTNP